MSFNRLLHKVSHAEAAAQAQHRRLSADWRQLKGSWRAAWTPGRLIVAGLISGYAVGSGKVGTATTGNSLRLLASLSALMTSHEAAAAAEAGEGVADTSQ